MKIVDANVLIYASNKDTPHHEVAHDWLDRSLAGSEVIGFPWVTLLAYVRLTTRAGIFSHPLTPAEAMRMVEAWLSQPPSVVVEPTSRHVGVLRGLLEECGTAGNLTTDAHIAALAVEHGADVASFDTDFARFSGVHLVKPA